MSKPKILIICPFVKPNLGGVETHIEKLTHAIISKGYYPVIITYQPLTRKAHGIPHEVHPDHEIIRQTWFGNGWFNKFEKYFPLQFLYLFPGLFFCSLKYYLRHHREIICIHAHGLVSATVVDLLNFIHPKRTVVSTHAIYHFSSRPLLSFFIKLILNPFDKILAVSQVSLEELTTLGIPLKKLAVHPNWIETNKFKPLKNKNKKTHDLLFVGRLIEMKGVLLFLEAASKIPSVRFHIVGDGPESNTVKKYAQNYSNITYYGSLSSFEAPQLKKLISLYNLADYLVSPYLYDEGFSSVLLESLSCGTPVIITDRGSPPTFISKNVSILLSKNPTSQELISLINKLFKSSVSKISPPECRNFALSNFSPRNSDIITDNYQ